jgi:endonuclease III
MNKYLTKIAQQLKEEAHPSSLGIDLDKGTDPELHKWLIAVTLFSKPIQRSVAARTSMQLSSEGIDSPEAIGKAGYSNLLESLQRGHYSRYDESTAKTLLIQAKQLHDQYGSISDFVARRTPEEIRKEIINLRGIGPMGSKLFVEGLEPHLQKFQKPVEHPV